MNDRLYNLAKDKRMLEIEKERTIKKSPSKQSIKNANGMTVNDRLYNLAVNKRMLEIEREQKMKEEEYEYEKLKSKTVSGNDSTFARMYGVALKKRSEKERKIMEKNQQEALD